MAASTTNSPIFSLFSSLPAELRNQIWQYALPTKIGPALHFWKERCWCPRRLTEGDWEYDPTNDDLNLNLEFRHDLLDDGQIEIPLAFVNREAHGIALGWAHHNDVKILPCQDGQEFFFVLPFDPVRDALYIAYDDFNRFVCDPFDRMFESDLYGRNVGCRSCLTCIAISEELLEKELDGLTELFQWHYPNVLCVVVNAPPGLHLTDDRVQRRWGFKNIGGGAFFWNIERNFFEFHGSGHAGYEAMYRLLEEVGKRIAGEVSRNERGFEIRPVFALEE